ncbi:MAG: cyclic nucleotide-binding domain-containing protein [Burkholderiales bacterium]
MQENRIEALQAMPIFGGIRNDVLAFLLGSSEVLSLREGEYFFHENDRAEALYVLESGEVAVLKLWSGRQNVLRNLHKGDCFGEMAIMDLFPRSASIRAVTPCSAIQLSTASFQKIYEMNLEQFAIIQMNIGREISRRLRVADEQLFRVRMGESEIDPAMVFPST